jgi:hypothetical protein
VVADGVLKIPVSPEIRGNASIENSFLQARHTAMQREVHLLVIFRDAITL